MLINKEYGDFVRTGTDTGIYQRYKPWICSLKERLSLTQGCTNTDRQVGVETKFSTVAPNICGASA
jgi:hypothetical protein